MKTRIAINEDHLASVLAQVTKEGLYVVEVKEAHGRGDTNKIMYHITTAVASELDRDIEPFYRMAKTCLYSSAATLILIAIIAITS